MRILIDECVDWRLARDIPGQWREDRPPNGLDDHQRTENLALAAAEFDIFVTVDQNLSFQQNLGSYPLAVIAPGATFNRLADLQPLIPKLLAAIERAQPSMAEFIGAN